MTCCLGGVRCLDPKSCSSSCLAHCIHHVCMKQRKQQWTHHTGEPGGWGWLVPSSSLQARTHAPLSCSWKGRSCSRCSQELEVVTSGMWLSGLNACLEMPQVPSSIPSTAQTGYGVTCMSSWYSHGRERAGRLGFKAILGYNEFGASLGYLRLPKKRKKKKKEKKEKKRERKQSL